MSILDDKDMWRRARARENAQELLAALKELVSAPHWEAEESALLKARALIARIEGNDER